jgi:rhamnosyltransferase subunit B
MGRILIATRGSFGDFQPFLAIATSLVQRGHAVVFVTNQHNVESVQKRGFETHAFDAPVGAADKENDAYASTVDGSGKGTWRVLTRLTQYLEAEFDVIARLAPQCDVLVGSYTSLALPLVARSHKRPWVYAPLAPMAFLSRFDPPHLHGVHHLRVGGVLPAWMSQLIFSVFRYSAGLHVLGHRQLERRLGLPALNPVFEGRYSPVCNLALFSPVMGQPQPDWPAHTVQCGFTLYEPAGSEHDAGELGEFMASGPAPVVFTVGGVARADPGDFYRHAIAACTALGLRAVLVKKSALDLGLLPSGIVAVNYASHAWLFPRARAIVHHGGIGTIAKVLLHGKPSLAVPRALDQFDNAERARALGCMRVLPFAKLSAASLQAELSVVLKDNSYAQAAQALSLSIAQERGTQIATDAIEALM